MQTNEKHQKMHVNQSQQADIEFIVKDIMVNKLGLTELQLLDSAHLQEDLGIDSLDMVEVLMEIDRKFNIRIADEEAEKMRTVGSIVRSVLEKTR